MCAYLLIRVWDQVLCQAASQGKGCIHSCFLWTSSLSSRASCRGCGTGQTKSRSKAPCNSPCSTMYLRASDPSTSNWAIASWHKASLHLALLVQTSQTQSRGLCNESQDSFSCLLSDHTALSISAGGLLSLSTSAGHEQPWACVSNTCSIMPCSTGPSHNSPCTFCLDLSIHGHDVAMSNRLEEGQDCALLASCSSCAVETYDVEPDSLTMRLFWFQKMRYLALLVKPDQAALVSAS